MDLVVYTAITGGREELPKFKLNPHYKYVLFTDIPDVELDGWIVRPAYSIFKDPNRNAKIHKVLSHCFFRNEFALWFDGNYDCEYDLDGLMEYLNLEGESRYHPPHAFDMCFMRDRISGIHKEAKEILLNHFDDERTIEAQLGRYALEGFGDELETYAGSIILRHNTEETQRFNAIWWSEICAGTRRDQLSLPYAIRKSGARVNEFPFRHGERNKFFRHRPHGARLG